MVRKLIALAVAFLVGLSIWPASAGADSRAEGSFLFDHYHDYAEIMAELERVSEEYPDICDLIVLGQTWEGRDIAALRVSDNPAQEEGSEPDVLIMGGHHAYELPSVEVPLYILEHLVGNYHDSASIRELVDSNDIWFVPLLNPDGREYALDTDQEWRKNRRPIDLDGNGVPEGIGVDLNRNYGHLWGQQGTSADPANLLYCGPSAFSENETQAIRNLALNQGFNISLSYHTYGMQVFYPWGNSIDTAHPRKQVLQAIAGDMADMIGYTPMEGKDFYLTTGDSDDWLYSEFSTLPFTIELGSQRAVPDSGIAALCQANLEAALYAIGIAAEPEEALLPEWTLMTYMSSDANQALADEAFVDLNEMEAGGTSQDVNLLVLYDGMAPGDSCIYDIQLDTGGMNTGIISPKVDDMGAVINQTTNELDMSDPATLRNFVSWTMENYPAKKYLLDFWGHGDGVLEDFVPDNNIGLLIKDLHTTLEGFELDIVGFDACSLGHFEIAHELRNIAGIMIGSEAEEPIAGWDYWTSMFKLVHDPTMSPKKLATTIVADYLAVSPQTYVTQAAIDVTVYRDRLLPLLNEFSNVSLDFAFADHSKIWQARNITDTFVTEENAVDLFEFLQNLNGTAPSAPVAARIQKILGLWPDLVLHSGTGTAHPEARSMAVYFPKLATAVSPVYDTLAFSEGKWDDYLKGIKYPQSRPVMKALEPGTARSSVESYLMEAEVDNYHGESINLVYRLDSGPWETLSATVADGGVSAYVPGQANGTQIEYYFLDTKNNITEPYEIKWGSTDYLALVVNASCDVYITGFYALNSGKLTEGNVTSIIVNCSNEGPEPASANLTLVANSTEGMETIGWSVVNLEPGTVKSLMFNWTARHGNWTFTATITSIQVFDRNLTNQSSSIQVNVSQIINPNNGFFAEYGLLAALLLSVWLVTMALIMHMLRKARKRRRDGIARSISAAREFVITAAQFGGDVSESQVMLARAEAALAKRAYPEAERLVSRARETAMNAVGEKGAEK